MSKDLEFETYLYISPRKLGIYLFDIKNQKNLYKEDLVIENPNLEINFNALNNFLEKNIFKIEKLIGKFIENIFLVIDSNKILNLDIGIKKKNYEKKIKKKYLEIILIEVKEQFKKAYQDQIIMHMIIKNFYFDGKYMSKLNNDLECESLCLDVKFISIPNELFLMVEKILRKYQINIIKCFDQTYLKSIFKEDNIEISEMAHKIRSGYNENEVNLVARNHENSGFFVKFFQLFS